MENLTLDQIKDLAQQTQSPSISLYLPTHRAQDTQQNAIRFKNLLRDVKQQLLDSGMRPREASALLQPAQVLLKDTLFWKHQQDGLALFLASDNFHYYHLPFHVEEQFIIARSYYIKPVLPLFTNNGHYYILAISQNEVRLFEGTRHSVGQIDLPEGTPESLEEALQFDDPEKQLQFHSGTSSSTAQGGIRSGMFHGQGPGDEEQRVRIERYLNLVDQGLKEIFREQQAPLVLAGVDYLLPIYRKASEYAHIMPEGITGSPEHLSSKVLQKRAWPIVEPYFRQATEEIVAQYQQLAGTDKATDEIEQIVAAAFYGRIDKLLLAIGAELWGSFNRDTGQVTHFQEAPSKEDDLPLLDFATMQTLQNGGTVYALSQDEMPTKSPVTAILRY